MFRLFDEPASDSCFTRLPWLGVGLIAGFVFLLSAVFTGTMAHLRETDQGTYEIAVLTNDALQMAVM